MTRNLKQNRTQTNTAKSILISSFCTLMPLSASAESQKNNPPPLNSTSPSTNREASLKVAKSIFVIMECYQVIHDIDKRSVDAEVSKNPTVLPITGQEALVEQIAQYVERGVKIPFLLIGFPFKSPNQVSKVISTIPDMAERRSMEYLHEMGIKIANIYQPGSEITVLCDGIPFGEFVNLTDDCVQNYESILKTLTQDLFTIKLVTSSDLLKDLELESGADLKKYIDRFSPSNGQFSQTLGTDSKLQEGHKTLMGRLAIEFDSPEGQAYLSSIGTDALKQITTALMAREMRLRSFVEQHFPPSQSIRLTVHYSKDVRKKFGIKLSPSSDVTPYHGVYVDEGNGQWSIRFKKDISLHEYERTSEFVNGIDCSYMRKIKH